jgi:hypothetical protein
MLAASRAFVEAKGDAALLAHIEKWRSPKMDLCAEGGQRSDSYLR